MNVIPVFDLDFDGLCVVSNIGIGWRFGDNFNDVITDDWSPFDRATSVHEGVLSASKNIALGKRCEITEVGVSTDDICVLPLQVITSSVLGQHADSTGSTVKVDANGVGHLADVYIAAVLDIGFEIRGLSSI